MEQYDTPSNFNFFAVGTQCRELLGMQFVNYVASGYDSHERVRDEIRHDTRDADVFQSCETHGAKKDRRGAWDHNFYWATRGMTEADRDEVWYSRQHNREPEFE